MPSKAPSEGEKSASFPISRRGFLKATTVTAASAGIAVTAGPLARDILVQQEPPAAPAEPRAWKTIRISLNGRSQNFRVKANWTLADFLRNGAGLLGTKVGCDLSSCGACTVLMDGAAVYACQRLAVEADGREITTIEGLGGDGLHPVQQGFIDSGSPQCGYCIPGQVMTAADLVSRNPNPTRDEVRRALAGNVCRCANYVKIVDGVIEGARILREGP